MSINLNFQILPKIILDIAFINSLKNKNIQNEISLFLDIGFYLHKKPVKLAILSKRRPQENDFLIEREEHLSNQGQSTAKNGLSEKE